MLALFFTEPSAPPKPTPLVLFSLGIEVNLWKVVARRNIIVSVSMEVASFFGFTHELFINMYVNLQTDEQRHTY